MVWVLAIVGIVIDSLHHNGPRIYQIIIYLLMGWVVLIALYPLIQNLPTGGFVLLVFGGLCYTGGMAFYALDEKLEYAHGIWHLFVLAGSISHFLAILLYVL